MKTDPNQLRTVLVTDCGSTTTKAVLFEKKADGWRQTFRGEAPTTVEEPVADVTVGALNAFQEVEELSGRKIITRQQTSLPFVETLSEPKSGIDLYLSTSSAGGGLQMIVTGAVKEMTTQSAERAALGAGAIVLDAISADDGREEHERVERIRHLKPDIVLMTGGTDGGSRSHVLEAAETILAAAPRPRFGDTLKLPVIYAGNNAAREEVATMLNAVATIQAVENVRPTLEHENLAPARDAIHELFLTHVMSHAPGYGKLLQWTPLPVLPTPAAVGDMVLSFAKERQLQVLAVDIGGATTDVFSVFCHPESGELIFNRTVSANLGMSYSVANVMVEAGVDNIARWLPFELPHAEIRDRLRNKMIRPTSIPQTMQDLLLEQAVCREALRLSLQHHRALAVGLSGTRRERGIADIFSQRAGRAELVDMLELDLVIGSGGVLSHAPHRNSAALMMIDAFELSGLTQLTVDSIFMMPHLGVFSSVHPQAAHEILLRDCLINIGHAVAPIYPKRLSVDELVRISFAGRQVGSVHRGKVELVSIPCGQVGTLALEPLSSAVNVGAGPGQPLTREVTGGAAGLFLDGRNRPLELPADSSARIAVQRAVHQALGLEV